MTPERLQRGISVVVPVYNSAEMLPELVKRLDKVLSAMGRDFELILVNDGSKDNSWMVIERLASGKPWVRGVGMMRNFGQHNALLAYVFIRHALEGSSVQGFPFLASIIATFSGAQLFALGIVGEYLARMHFRIMDKPSYLVAVETGKPLL
jgi:glycosyltransferase involved in cell wall biosynthesis